MTTTVPAGCETTAQACNGAIGEVCPFIARCPSAPALMSAPQPGVAEQLDNQLKKKKP
jgi:hypothetical protein